jgi:hypothetical protein
VRKEKNVGSQVDRSIRSMLVVAKEERSSDRAEHVPEPDGPNPVVREMKDGDTRFHERIPLLPQEGRHGGS